MNLHTYMYAPVALGPCVGPALHSTPDKNGAAPEGTAPER